MDHRIDYRVVFEKTGNAKYISHLDLNRCMQRAIRRSGLPAWYTEGFHPHMYLMFSLALSLGAESLCETMDMRLTAELPFQEVQDRLNRVLPEGLKVHEVRTPKHTAAEIGSALYHIVMFSEDLTALEACWHHFMEQDVITAEKHTKRGMKKVDIRPMLEVVSLDQKDGKLELFLRLPAGNEGNLNVSVVLDAFRSYAEQPFQIASVMREKIFCLNGEEFF